MFKIITTLATLFLAKGVLSVGEELIGDKTERRAQYRGIDWCYHKTKSCRENQWPGTCNTGKFQSPVNLPGNITKVNLKNASYIPVANFPRSSYILQGFKMEFTGKTLQLWPIYEEDSERLSFRWENHDEDIKYKFHSLHFHWGSTDGIGSEHAIDGKPFSAEVHLVYFDSRWGSMENALTSSNRNTILVMAVFLETSSLLADDDDDNNILSFFMEPIVKNLEQLTNTEEYAELSGWLNLGDLFSSTKAYTYLGSLTTPKCTENVVWIVLRKPLLVPLVHLKSLRTMQFKDVGNFYNNFRSLQMKRNNMLKNSNDVRNIGIIEISYS